MIKSNSQFSYVSTSENNEKIVQDVNHMGSHAKIGFLASNDTVSSAYQSRSLSLVQYIFFKAFSCSKIGHFVPTINLKQGPNFSFFTHHDNAFIKLKIIQLISRRRPVRNYYVNLL